MSLNWSTEEVKFFKDNPDKLWVTWQENGKEVSDVNAETKSLIFGSISVGIGNITETNCSEWYARWKMYERFDDFFLYSKFDGVNTSRVYLSPEVITKHINLSTNVGYESSTNWIKRFVKRRPSLSLSDAKGLLFYYKFEFKEMTQKEEEKVNGN